LATGDRNGEVLVWEAAKAQEYLSLRGHTAAVTGLSWRADGNVLASCSDDSSIRLWEMENGKQIKTWNAHGGVQWAEFCRDGRLATCGRDHQVRLWSGDGKQQGKDLPLPDLALRVVATTDSNRLIGGDWTGEIRVWNSADGKQLGSLSANPSKLEELLAAATQALSSQRKEQEQLIAIAKASNLTAAKSTDDLSNAKRALDAVAAAETTGKAELGEMQKTVDQTAAEIDSLKANLANQESAVVTLIDVIAKSQLAADKVPGNNELADALSKLKSASESLSNEVAASHKSLDDKNRELTADQEKLTERRKNLEKLVSDAETAHQQIETLAAAAKTAGGKAAADKQAADQAAAAVEHSQAEARHWTDEIEFARSAAK
jgi:hypothetical protein